MRSALLAATLLTIVAIPLAASATTTDSFTITGTDVNNAPYQIAFTLNPASFIGTYADGFSIANVTGTVDHVSDVFNIYEYAGADTYLDLNDDNNGSGDYGPDYAQQLVLLPNTLQLFSNSPTSTPTVNLGTYSGYDDTNCDASLHTPSLGVGGPLSTLALFQIPVIQTNCGSLVSVNATSSSSAPTPPTAVTPEPTSLALFGSGALGLFGLARRRFVR